MDMNFKLNRNDFWHMVKNRMRKKQEVKIEIEKLKAEYKKLFSDDPEQANNPVHQQDL